MIIVSQTFFFSLWPKLFENLFSPNSLKARVPLSHWPHAASLLPARKLIRDDDNNKGERRQSCGLAARVRAHAQTESGRVCALRRAGLL